MFEIHPALLTLGYAIISAIIAFAVSWGASRTKINYLTNRLEKLEIIALKVTNLPEKIEKIEKSHESLKKWIYDSFDKMYDNCDTHEKELNLKINTEIKELDTKVSLNIKEIEKILASIEKNCATRQIYTQIIPEITKDINQLKIEMSTLPATISKELSKSFSDEYQKLFSILASSHKDANKS